MRRLTLLLTAAAILATGLLAGSPASATAATALTIRASDGVVNRIGDYRPQRNPSLAGARRAFGRPASRAANGSACTAKWRRLRLRILFANFGGGSACGAGSAQTFTVRGRRFETWKGLRVGQPSSAVKQRHPNADFRDGTWWLQTATSPYGEGEDAEYGVVRAIVSGGRVRALTGWIGAAGD